MFLTVIEESGAKVRATAEAAQQKRLKRPMRLGGEARHVCPHSGTLHITSRASLARLAHRRPLRSSARALCAVTGRTVVGCGSPIGHG